MSMKDWINSSGLLWLRVLMGVGIATHGFGKVFGGHIEGFSQGVAQMGFPAPLLFAWLSALAEFLGGICIALGLGTRIAAFFVLFNMFVASFIFHQGDPFGVKELALAYFTVAGALVLLGPGRFSLDALLQKLFLRWEAKLWVRPVLRLLSV